MKLTQKIRIYPSEDQQKVLWILSEKCRLIYNFALQERREHWNAIKDLPEDQRTYISYNDQQNKLPKLKLEYPEYKWVYSKVLQMVLKKLDADYASFYALNKVDPNARPPNFKGKQYFTTLCYNQSGFKIEENKINFSHKHPSKIPIEFTLSILPSEKVIQTEIFLDHENRWFISLTYNHTPIPYVDNGEYQAIDLGVSNIVSAVNTHGKSIQIKNKRSDLYWKKKIEQVHSKRDHCKKKSKRWKRYNKKYKYMKRKCANQMKDFQHKISKKIVTNTKANTIIIGDLEVKKMAKKTNKGTKISPQQKKAKKTLHHSVQNTGSMGRFAQFLTYKAEKIGKRVIRIDESNTTKVCAKCGKKERRMLSERTIQCDCGNNIDRDLNSAINIMVKFLKTLSHEPSVNEESFLSNWNGFTTIHSSIRNRSNRRLVGSHVL